MRGYMTTRSIDDFLSTQRVFSDLFFDATEMSEEELAARHQIFALALHSEVSDLANAVPYKDHRPIQDETKRQKILYETVDVMRYCLAVLNLWRFSGEDFEDAFDSRDAFLWDRETRGLQNWDGRPVVIVDVDDIDNPPILLLRIGICVSTSIAIALTVLIAVIASTPDDTAALTVSR